MSDSVADLLSRGVAAAKAREKDEARFYLEWALRRGDASYEQQANAWLWLSQVVDDPTQKRECLEHVLAINPAHALARRGLAMLSGKLRAEDVLDHSQPVQPVQPAQADAQPEMRRYMCPKCGGRMAFDPGRRALSCGYCGNKMWEYEALMKGALVQESDFAATLPTLQAHQWELPAERVLACKGCGASFTMPPLQVTTKCPFCESAYVAETESRELIQPAGVLPFKFDDAAASRLARDWLRGQAFCPSDLKKKSSTLPMRGVYLPFWTFDLNGEIKWCAVIRSDSGYLDRYGARSKTVTRNDSSIVSYDDVLVAASRALPVDMLNELADDFDTHALLPYTPDLLADWATEIYQLPMANASLLARQRVVEAVRRHVTNTILSDSNVVECSFNSMGLAVDSYKLVLLPVWVGGYHYQKQRYHLALNGQTGKAVGDVPRSGVQKALAWIFGED